jgi:predicted MFS family arabinose efflux permease
MKGTTTVTDFDARPQIQDADQVLFRQPAASESAKLPRQLSAFRHRNYRLFFFGQMISLTGTWLQQVAQGWLVRSLTDPSNRGLMMGIIGAIGSLPILLCSLPAGVIAEKLNKRNLLVVTQISAMLLAFTLAALTQWNAITVHYLMAIALLLGTVNAFDAPTRQSFVIEMVGREDLPNAIALNSAMFNGARILGPAVAGIAIAAVGIAGTFFLNGLSFIAVIIGLLLMQIDSGGSPTQSAGWQAIKEGLHFIQGSRMVTALLALTAVVSIFATPYMIFMPIFAGDILHVGERGLGFLMSAVGAGALIGAVTLSSLGSFKAKGKLLLAGNLVFCTAMAAFSFSKSMPLSLGLLLFVGWGLMINMALTNTLIQLAVPDELRGRVISVYTLMFLGMTPIGSLQAGLMSHALTVPATVLVGAIICAAIALLLSPRFIQATGHSS